MDGFEVVWVPDEETASGTNTARFMAAHGFDRYQDLVEASRSDPEWFWAASVDFLGVPFQRAPSVVMDTSRGDPWATWFPDGQFNLARACLDRWVAGAPDRLAVRSQTEAGRITDTTFEELLDMVTAMAGSLQGLGVRKGDAVAVYLPMSTEAVVAFLAVARIGAIFVPVFSGFGEAAVAARLADPKPRVVICPDGFGRRGRRVDAKEVADRACELAGGIERVVVVRYSGRPDTPVTEGRDVWWHDLLSGGHPETLVTTYAEDPVMIAYTSGTTGRPKGAVHVHAGFTVKVAAEGAFQLDIRPEDVLMWFTDMGWIMGPWMVVAGLANGAAIATYDGAPDHPGPGRVWDVASELGVTILGVSPTLVRSLQPHGRPSADLTSLRLFGSTGEPWNTGPWMWLFEEVGEGRVPIINISGGTEIGACILSANLLQGIKPTSLGGPALGMDADVFDENGEPVRGAVGELVIRAPWPGMTRGFWGEPDRYLETYWSRYPGVWAHGDWASIDGDGFWYLHGRSDDTLNIAGKRLGPAEVETAAVSLDEVIMAAAIGLPDESKGEVIAVYVVAAPSVTPDEALSSKVSEAVVASLGKAFRPARVEWVADLPRTRSQKIMRRVVKAAALGRDPGDLSSLENPESLESLGRSG